MSAADGGMACAEPGRYEVDVEKVLHRSRRRRQTLEALPAVFSSCRLSVKQVSPKCRLDVV